MKKFFERLKKELKSTLGFVLLFSAIIFGWFFFILPDNATKTENVSYTEFEKMLEKDEVNKVTIDFTAPKFSFETDDQNLIYITDNPRTEGFKEKLLINGVEVTEVDPNAFDSLFSGLRTTLWILFVILMISFFYRTMKVGTGNNSKPLKDVPNTKFRDIAGHEEAKEEMQFLVDFLKNPKKYEKMGAKLPKGVILYGPPGTGKTLTAKAIAGEAGVPFFSVSGSDFIEMFVGVGAKRVRDLFTEARKNAPSIIFIDEIDALGGNRDNMSTSEHRQTINQFLKEMDGFNSKTGVIVIGATNRLEDLDPAFIRPGRFDKHIALHLPDQEGRLSILKVHAKNKKFADNVSLEDLAKMTIGMSGAYLESILNESAILATTRNHEVITKEDIDDAFFKVVMQGHKKRSGNERKDEEVRLVAWHEAGHALATKLLTDNEVPQVTIIPSTSGAGGVTFVTPNKMGLHSKEELMNNVKVLYAGRIGEYLLLGDENKITTGASQDIRQATTQIKQIINDFGMSDAFGMLNLSLLGNPQLQSLSENELFVKEAVKLSKELYQETLDVLTENKHILQAIAESLMEKETLTENELDMIIMKNQQKGE